MCDEKVEEPFDFTCMIDERGLQMTQKGSRIYSENRANTFRRVRHRQFVKKCGWKILVNKGEVRTINDRNICERRSCMKSNGKSPTFKFVSGEERRASEVQRVSGLAPPWRHALVSGSHLDPKWLEIQAGELPELESVELELGSCCSDLEKQVSDEICRARKRQFEIPFRL